MSDELTIAIDDEKQTDAQLNAIPPALMFATALPHLSIQDRHEQGLNPLLLCTCGAKMELDYSTFGMKARVALFCDLHEDCQETQRVVN